jgi:hypothetical protein
MELPGPATESDSNSAASSAFSAQAIHLVRTVTQVNLSLSQMADQKASILMGATFVVFTITVGQAARGQFPASLMVLALFAFISAMLAVAAVVPSVGRKRDGSENPNLLFFGVFANLSEADFTDKVLAELRSDEQIFRIMLRDVYQNGQVLQRKKYRFLGLAYRSFQIGLVLTFVVFLLESGGRQF